MTPEQKQRIEQIRERVKRLELAAKDPHVKTWDAAYYGDVHFLLSLVKSQEAPGQSALEIAADIVREWSEHDMNEHYGSDYLADEFGAGHLEERIATAITNAATSTRSACVEKVKKKASSYQADADNKSLLPNYRKQMAFAASALREAANELESVTLQEQEAKQS